MRILLAPVVVGIAALSLAACSPGGGDSATTTAAVPETTTAVALPSETPLVEPTEDTSPVPSTEDLTGGGDTQCLLGDWALDVPDYRDQSEAYLTSLGLPLDSYSMEGTGSVTFTAEYVSVSADLLVDATVQGIPLSVPSQYAGGGDWFWDADDDSIVTVEDWGWTVEPEESADGVEVAPLIPPDEPLTVNCDGDSLSIQGQEAPLVGNFTRVS